MVPDGSHLHYWDSDAAALVNQRGMEISNHWCGPLHWASRAYDVGPLHNACATASQAALKCSVAGARMSR